MWPYLRKSLEACFDIIKNPVVSNGLSLSLSPCFLLATEDGSSQLAAPAAMSARHHACQFSNCKLKQTPPSRRCFWSQYFVTATG